MCAPQSGLLPILFVLKGYIDYVKDSFKGGLKILVSIAEHLFGRRSIGFYFVPSRIDRLTGGFTTLLRCQISRACFAAFLAGRYEGIFHRHFGLSLRMSLPSAAARWCGHPAAGGRWVRPDGGRRAGRYGRRGEGLGSSDSSRH